MYAPETIIGQLFEVFDKSSIALFRTYLRARPGITKWMIASDYCLHDPTRPGDSFAFSIIPYDNWPNTLQAQIRAALPRDIKKTKNVGPNAVAYLRQSRLFHIGVILNKDRVIFTNGNSQSRLEVARECVRLSVNAAVQAQRGADEIAHLKELQQESYANSFNVELMTDLVLLATLYSFVTLLLMRESPAQMIGWFSDRDNLTTWCSGVLWHFVQENVLGMAARLGIPAANVKFSVAVPDQQAQGAGAMWYDDFVRIADYVAGTLAAWDVSANLVLKEKFGTMLREFMADAANITVIRMTIAEQGMQSSRLNISRTPTLTIINDTIKIASTRVHRAHEMMFRLTDEQRAYRLQRATAFLRARVSDSGPKARLNRRFRDEAAILLSQRVTKV